MLFEVYSQNSLEKVKEGKLKVVQVWGRLSEGSTETKEALDVISKRTNQEEALLGMEERKLSEALRVVSKECQEGKVMLEQHKPITKRLCGEMAVLEKVHAVC